MPGCNVDFKVQEPPVGMQNLKTLLPEVIGGKCFSLIPGFVVFAHFPKISCDLPDLQLIYCIFECIFLAKAIIRQQILVPRSLISNQQLFFIPVNYQHIRARQIRIIKPFIKPLIVASGKKDVETIVAIA
jgi:hypothetical protein